MSGGPTAPQGSGSSGTNVWQRAPLGSKALLITITAVTVIGWLTNIDTLLLNCPGSLSAGQIWRIFTAPIMQPTIFGLLFCVLTLFTSGPQAEYRLGTIGLGWLFMLSSVIASLCGAVAANFMSETPGEAIGFQRCTGGAWPALLAFIAYEAYCAPETVRPMLCCPPVKNKYYPWILALLFFVLSGGAEVGVPVGCAIGMLAALDKLGPLMPSMDRLNAWESGCCSAVARLPGYARAGYMQAPEGVAGAQGAYGGWHTPGAGSGTAPRAGPAHGRVATLSSLGAGSGQQHDTRANGNGTAFSAAPGAVVHTSGGATPAASAPPDAGHTLGGPSNAAPSSDRRAAAAAAAEARAKRAQGRGASGQTPASPGSRKPPSPDDGGDVELI